jgi:hypothetical protein
LVSSLENYGDTEIFEMRMRGSVRNIDYSIGATRTEAHIIFDIYLAGRSVQLRLRREDFPEMDLRTIREGVASDNEPHTLRFGVAFGEPGECFGTPTLPKKLAIRYNVEGCFPAPGLLERGASRSGMSWIWCRQAPAPILQLFSDALKIS